MLSRGLSAIHFPRQYWLHWGLGRLSFHRRVGPLRALRLDRSDAVFMVFTRVGIDRGLGHVVNMTIPRMCGRFDLLRWDRLALRGMGRTVQATLILSEGGCHPMRHYAATLPPESATVTLPISAVPTTSSPT
jgi:hypothetical protein